MTEYLYRVDRIEPSRRLTDFLSPRVWDGFPHKSLIQAQASVGPDDVIARISFWRSEILARKNGFTSHANTHILIRVRRDYVERVFNGWHFEDDDCIPNRALLVWDVVARSDIDGDFLNRGLDLKELEVLDGGRWLPWLDSLQLRPLQHRLRTLGWQSCFIPDRNLSLRSIAWIEERVPEHPDRTALIIALDPQAGGAHLMGDPEDLTILVNHVVASSWPRLTLPSWVLVVWPDANEVYVSLRCEAGRIRWAAQHQSAWRRWSASILRMPQEPPFPTIEKVGDLSAATVESMLRVSGVRSAFGARS